jgi:hypothetical protein
VRSTEWKSRCIPVINIIEPANRGKYDFKCSTNVRRSFLSRRLDVTILNSNSISFNNKHSYISCLEDYWFGLAVKWKSYSIPCSGGNDTSSHCSLAHSSASKYPENLSCPPSCLLLYFISCIFICSTARTNFCCS